MKKGISIWSFPAGSLKESFALAKKAGYDGVEVAMAEDGKIMPETGKEALLAIKAEAEAQGLSLYSVASGMYWSCSLTADDEGERERAKYLVRRQLEIAKLLGCDTILILPGCVSSFDNPKKVVDYETAYERSLAALCELSRDAERLGVCIGIENVWNKFILSPVEMRDFIDKVGSPFVGSYFDVGNVVANGFPEHWIRTLKGRIKKIHFKDYRYEAGGLCGFVDLLAGDVNYPAVMEALREVGYDGWVTAEMIPAYTYYPETILYNTSLSMDKILGRQ